MGARCRRPIVVRTCSVSRCLSLSISSPRSSLSLSRSRRRLLVQRSDDLSLVFFTRVYFFFLYIFFFFFSVYTLLLLLSYFGETTVGEEWCGSRCTTSRRLRASSRTGPARALITIKRNEASCARQHTRTTEIKATRTIFMRPINNASVNGHTEPSYCFLVLSLIIYNICMCVLRRRRSSATSAVGVISRVITTGRRRCCSFVRGAAP